ncbi:ABC transporter ATP-binding protein [Lachnobacterium bovis]|uniref:Putative ABC transport system ATP-binding protein n=1 Tax=Lachnobacterium bovis TaxID=140626 RepID=A0A1H9R2I7_9FIRM|nr:ABC transporter ATP-binding protein [Lachnobacterium bovis]SER66827.1 putative ABC transport system ATP-binding protein [Lachnobacterium bovis]
MSELIIAKDLCKTFSNNSVQQHVLKNLNLEIHKGEFLVIMGNSGSGKSTLLYSLSGMDRITLGKIIYDGTEIQNYSDAKLCVFRGKNTGFVFQQNFLNDTLTVLDNVMVCGLLTHKNRKKLVQKVKTLLLHVGIKEEDFNKFPSQLSGGQKQRVAVVRGIINEPQVLFADEPTGALNSDNTEKLLDILTDMNEKGQTIVMVTHSVEAARRGDRVMYLEDGIIKDTIELGKYSKREKSVNKKLNHFLEEMGW